MEESPKKAPSKDYSIMSIGRFRPFKSATTAKTPPNLQSLQ